MYYVYVLLIKKSGRYYIGQTQDLAKRLEKHSRGKTKSMKNRGPFEVVYVEKCSSRADAMRREKEIKRYKGDEAFRRLLSGFAKQTMIIAELAEVSRLRRDGINSCSPARGGISRVPFDSSYGLAQGLTANPGLSAIIFMQLTHRSKRMDSLQNWAGLYFNLKAVAKFLTNYRSQYGKHTKYKELEITLLFVSFLSKDQRRLYLIGFPTLHGLQNDDHVTLAKTFERKMALDEDFDIVIAPKQEAQQKNHRLQIVRFTGDVEGNTESLFSFLKEKKFNIPKDENLILLVMLEKDFQFNYLELAQKFEKINVPYGQIFIIGQRKPNESYVFFCCQVFPEVKIFRNLDFSFSKRAEEAKA